MSVGYNPQVNDYVVWTTELGQVHKGWVYFVASEVRKEKRLANACEIYFYRDCYQTSPRL